MIEVGTTLHVDSSRAFQVADHTDRWGVVGKIETGQFVGMWIAVLCAFPHQKTDLSTWRESTPCNSVEEAHAALSLLVSGIPGSWVTLPWGGKVEEVRDAQDRPTDEAAASDVARPAGEARAETRRARSRSRRVERAEGATEADASTQGAARSQDAGERKVK